MSKWGIAGCPRCDVPLVCTLAFDRYEFYCLDCGGKFGFFEPTPIAETTAALADMDRRNVEFRENAADLLPQHRHGTATKAALEAHERALKWLDERKVNQ